MADAIAHQELVERTVAPRQRRPRRVTVVPVPEVVVAPEIEAVQGGRFSPLTHSGDEEDVARIAAAPPVTTTLPRARIPRDAAVRALTQRIRNIVRLAGGRGPVDRQKILRQISRATFQLRGQTARRLYSWQRGQTAQQPADTVPVVRPPAVTPAAGRRPRRRGRRQQRRPAQPQVSSEVAVPEQPVARAAPHRRRWVWRRRQADTPVDPVEPVETAPPSDTEQFDDVDDLMDIAVTSGAEAVPMMCDEEVAPTPEGSPDRVETESVRSPHRIGSPMSPYIAALQQHFLENDDTLTDELEEEVPVHRVCVVTRRGHSDEREPEDQDEQGDPEVGGSPRSVDTDATVLHLQTQMAEMARAMAAMTAQLTALGAMPQVTGVAATSTSREQPVVPPATVDPVGVDRVQRVVPAPPTVLPYTTSVQSQPAQMSAGQIQDLIAQKVEQAISSRKTGESVSRGRPYPVEYEQEPYPLVSSLLGSEFLTGLGTRGSMWLSTEPYVAI
ncbi:hypothetical protein MA16_Dca025747 [Dendrobium catenatum]|uniref:Uncharacterized protein n=1 Tax=Dendrobium catenatum TaxID=906689 RepID=A0A2I0VE31_9ASPA|nr:hypothetical protein MA16_Dca025747 [Dendrobium catenatum]